MLQPYGNLIMKWPCQNLFMLPVGTLFKVNLVSRILIGQMLPLLIFWLHVEIILLNSCQCMTKYVIINVMNDESCHSYVAQDHVEQIQGPTSLTFNLDGTQIYAGFDSRIHVFDTQRPGNQSRVILTTPTRKSKQGQKGNAYQEYKY